MLYGSVGRVGLRSSVAPFSPAQLFVAGEQGAWYDPSDFSTMFQDAAGTTPVTGVEQPVGLVLDKSRGLVLGAEAVPNLNFTSGWTTAGVGSIVDQNTLSATGGAGGAYRDIGLVTGAWYYVTVTVTVTGTTVSLANSAGLGAGYILQNVSSGSYTAYFNAANANLYFRLSGNGSVDVTSVSVKSIAGNHASQTTSTSRPVLSARVNLLTYSEQFDNAAWNKVAITSTVPTVVANAGVAPNGTTTADRVNFGVIDAAGDASIVSQFFTSEAISYSAGIWIKGVAAGDVGKTVFVYFSDAGTVKGMVAVTVSSDWQYVAISSVLLAGASRQFSIATLGPPYGGANQAAVSVYLWGADLRPSNQVNAGMPNYQRIADANTYDTSGFPYYLAFDGTDDFLVTSTINPGSVDKAQVFAGVRKIGTADAMIVELSVDASSNSGSFYVGGPLAGGSWRYAFISRGTATASAITTDAAYNSPITNVLTAQSGISTNNATLRLNGAEAGTSSANQGTGNFGSYPLYIGRRAGTSLPFNGRIYGLIVRFSATNLPNGVIVQTEDWMDVQTFGENLALVYSDELTTALGELITAADGDQIYMTVSYV